MQNQLNVSQEEVKLEHEAPESTPFNYNQLDDPTASFLKERENNIITIASNTIVQTGKELNEAQERLSKCGYGCFEEWYTSLGFKKQTVYNYINYFKMIVQRLDKQELIEALPKSLVYEIAKPNADKEAKEQVLVGNISTLKEFKEIEQRNRELEKQVEELKNRPPEIIEKEVTKEVQVGGGFQQKYFDEQYKVTLLEGKIQRLEREPKVVEKIVPPSDYEHYKSTTKKLQDKVFQLQGDLSNKKFDLESLKGEVSILEKKAKLNDDDAKKYAEMKKQIDFLYKEKSDLSRQIESATELSGLAVKIDNLLKKELAPIRYSRVFERMDSDVARENLLSILDQVGQWCNDMRNMIPEEYRRVEVYHE